MDPFYVHFVGIGGTAMASAAAMMRELGHRVTGSDGEIYPPMSDFLAERDILVFQGYSPSNLDGNPELVVIGNALSRGNEEVEAVLERRLHYVSLPELLKERFIRGKRSFVVSGTHGKTTTSSLLAWILTSTGRDPTFLVGGIPVDFGAGFRLGRGSAIVLEGDEYDTAFFDKRAKFLHYLPEVVLLHNIEFDHGDIYRDIEEVRLAFRRLVHLVPRNGRIVANWDDPNVREVSEKAFCPVVRYGLDGERDWALEGFRFDEGMAHFVLLRHGRFFGSFRANLWGRHNLRNLMAAIAVAGEEGIPVESIQKGVETFHGVRRRLERIGERAGIVLYDDFAHHPTAIRETLKALREAFPERTIWALFEPRSNTLRRRIFQEELACSLALADRVVIAAVHRAEALHPEERLDPNRLAESIVRKGRIEAYSIPRVEDIVAHVSSGARRGDIVVFMSNGAFGGIQGKLLDALSIRDKEER